MAIRILIDFAIFMIGLAAGVALMCIMQIAKKSDDKRG